MTRSPSSARIPLAVDFQTPKGVDRLMEVLVPLCLSFNSHEHHRHMGYKDVAFLLDELCRGRTQEFIRAYDYIAKRLRQRPAPLHVVALKLWLIEQFPRRLREIGCAAERAETEPDRVALKEVVQELEQAPLIYSQREELRDCMAHLSAPMAKAERLHRAELAYELQQTKEYVQMRLDVRHAYKDKISAPIRAANQAAQIPFDRTVSVLRDNMQQPIGFMGASIGKGGFAKVRPILIGDELKVARSVHTLGSRRQTTRRTRLSCYEHEQEARSVARPQQSSAPPWLDQRARLLTIEEAMEGGSVADLQLMYAHAMPEVVVWHTMTALVAQLAPLHEADWVHLDIKPDNLLWNQEGVVLSDFGLADRVGQAKGHSGTAGFFAPETFLNPQAIAQSADMFSIGVTLLELIAPERIDELPYAESHRLLSHGLGTRAGHGAINKLQEACDTYANWHLQRMRRTEDGHCIDVDGIFALAPSERTSLDDAVLAVAAFEPMLVDVLFDRLLHPEPARRGTLDDLQAELTAWASKAKLTAEDAQRELGRMLGSSVTAQQLRDSEHHLRAVRDAYNEALLRTLSSPRRPGLNVNSRPHSYAGYVGSGSPTTSLTKIAAHAHRARSHLAAAASLMGASSPV